MKNRVDIAKLIDKKYNNNEFSLREFNELIDSVLSETMDVRTKLDTTNLEEISQGEDVFDHAYGMGGAENPIAKKPGYGGREPSNVIPDKIAEAPEQDTISPQKRVEKTFRVPVPDLYSLMTNPKLMQAGKDERSLVNDIMFNIGAPDNNWAARIEALKKYTKFQDIPDAGSTNEDITKTISSMIMLNVLKKVSYFTDKPGKQFEYVFAPFIHPQATVAGEEQDTIEDVNSPNGYFSLKFLESGKKIIRGSKKNLLNRILSIQDPNKKFVDYLIASPTGGGVVQFARVGITVDFDFIKANYPNKVGGGDKNSLWAIDKGAKSSIDGMPAYVYYIALSKEDIASVKSIKKTDILAGKNINIGGLQIPVSIVMSGKPIKIRELGMNINQYFQGLRINIEEFFKKENETEKKKILNKILEELKKLPDWQEKVRNNNPITKDPNGIKQYVNDIRASYRQQFDAVKAGIESSAAPEQPSALEEAQQQEEPSEENKAQFSIDATQVWNSLIIKYLNLGDPESYNQQQVRFASRLASMYEKVLTNLEGLTTSITKYFATAGDNQAGIQAISHTKEIKKGLAGIIKTR